MENTLRRTRLSLFYLAGYAIPSGIMLTLAPAFTLKLLYSNGQYSEVILRLAGVILIALGIFIAQMIRHNVTALYPTTLVVRGLILAALAWFYATTHDPFFIALTAVVGFGFLLTGYCYLADRAAKPTAS